MCVRGRERGIKACGASDSEKIGVREQEEPECLALHT